MIYGNSLSDVTCMFSAQKCVQYADWNDNSEIFLVIIGNSVV